jgi:hypothetical protein
LRFRWRQVEEPGGTVDGEAFERHQHQYLPTLLREVEHALLEIMTEARLRLEAGCREDV